MASNCALYSVVRCVRKANGPTEMQIILQVRERETDDLDEGEAMACWFDADAILTALRINGMDADHSIPPGRTLQ